MEDKTATELDSNNTEFFSQKSLSVLARSQKIEVSPNASNLAGGFPDEEDVDEFLRHIYDARSRSNGRP